MADISQVKLPNGDTYNLVDETSGYIKNYTETDPVFSASAAAGITATDISNWNGKSSTDEKLKTISGSSATQYYPIFGNATSTAETKRYSNNFRVTDYNSELELQIGQVSSNPIKGTIKLVSNQAQGYVLLRTVATSGKTITLPDKDGTIALTSDIPQVYSSTNTGGYLTMATLPIYDGTVV